MNRLHNGENRINNKSNFKDTEANRTIFCLKNMQVIYDHK